MEVLQGARGRLEFQAVPALDNGALGNGFTVKTLLQINGGRGDVSRGGPDYPGSTACPSPLISNWISLNV